MSRKTLLLHLINILYSPLLLIWFKQGLIYGKLIFLLERRSNYSITWTLQTFILV